MKISHNLRINLLRYAVFLLTGFIGYSSLYASEDYPRRPSIEFTKRGGLPNFFSKLDQGKPVTIAYLGGSITAQKGWRLLSQQWFETQYPNNQITGVAAAIGGTGSDLGVFRVEKDALSKRPDLLFVEFAVNDKKSAPEDVLRAVEGIVRKTWAANPETDICFVYTLTFYESKEVANGTMKQSTSIMEMVADHYGIPSIHMGLQAALMEKSGELIMKTNAPMTRVSGEELDAAPPLATDDTGRIIFSKDGVHPYPETGHVLYTEALIRAMEKMRSNQHSTPHILTPPIRQDNWENAQQINLPESFLEMPYRELSGTTHSIAQRFKSQMPILYQVEPGGELSFKFKGTKVSIYDVLGPDGAMLEITLDGNTRIIKRMDGYCTYHRLSILEIGGNLEDSVHAVRIRVLDKPFDKRSALFERNRKDFETSPGRYSSYRWYPGVILIVGEIGE